jgi:hypothetical protein
VFIDRVKIDRFGRLRGEWEFARGRVNLVCANNENGKTTLADAILHSFYGLQTRGGARATLKPSERYRPWGGDSEPFATEILMELADGRRVVLRCDFDRQKPFDLRDAATGRILPLEGQSFGERILGMSVQGFTDCFFMRQDSGEITGRDELVQAVEQAASARESGAEAPVRRALLALEGCRVSLADGSTSPLTVDVALRRLAERAESARAALRALEQDKEARSGDIARAAGVDEEIGSLRAQQARLEHELLCAERAEVEGLLEKQRLFDSAAETRRARRRELEAYAGYDPAAGHQAQALEAELQGIVRQAEATRLAAERDIAAPLRIAGQDLALFPEGLAGAAAADLDRLRSLKMAFLEQRGQIAHQSVHRDELKANLRHQGVPVDDFESLRERIRAMPVADFRALSEHDSQKAAIEVMLAENQARLAEAESVVTAARARRDHLRTLSSASFLGALFIAALVLLFLLLKMGWLSAVFLVAAVALAAVGFWQVHRSQVQAAVELDPAVAAEISQESEVRRLQQRAEELESDFLAAMERRNLKPDDLGEIRRLGQWSQLLAPCQAAEEMLQRMELGVGEIRRQVAEVARAALPAASPDEVDEIFLNRCIREFERYFETVARRDRLAASAQAAEAELAALDARALEVREGIESLLPQETAGADLAERVRLLAEGCAKAAQLRALDEEPAGGGLLGEQEQEQLRARSGQISARLADIEARHPGLGAPAVPARPRADIQQELDHVAARREELRLQRVAIFGECDRAVEAWRRDGPRLEAELERLRRTRQGVEDFRDAVEIAHGQMSEVAQEVFTSWARALNERVNEIAPLLGSRCTQLQFGDSLELSAWSDEAGRRLEGRELQHLSRGARDQLNLAVRVAVSEYLSAHVGCLPLVFDEPFAHWDDARFVQGMRFLAGIAERHQVIVLSCHQWRYDRLLQERPETAGTLELCRFGGNAPD